MGLESRPGGEMVGTPCGDVDGGEEIDHGNRACDLQVGIGRPAARVNGARCQGERGVSAGGRAGASIGPHLADRGFCPPYAVRSMLTTHPPCAGAWREPRAQECAASVRATRAHVGLPEAVRCGQAVATSRADRHSPHAKQATGPHWPCWPDDFGPTHAAAAKAFGSVAFNVPASSMSANS